MSEGFCKYHMLPMSKDTICAEIAGIYERNPWMRNAKTRNRYGEGMCECGHPRRLHGPECYHLDLHGELNCDCVRFMRAKESLT